MGRSSHEKAQENRARILDNANLLFRQHGAENVSVSDVMGACGMTVGGFYKHFESKEALVNEACGQAFTQALSNWDAVYQKADAAAQDRQVALVRRYLSNRAPERRCPVLAYAPMQADSQTTASTQTYQSGLHELFEKFLQGSQATQADSKAAPSQESMLLFAAMIGARVLNQAAGDAHWIRDIENAVIAAAAHPGPNSKSA